MPRTKNKYCLQIKKLQVFWCLVLLTSIVSHFLVVFFFALFLCFAILFLILDFLAFLRAVAPQVPEQDQRDHSPQGGWTGHIKKKTFKSVSTGT